VIRCLLVQPNAESALNEEAGKLILDDYDRFSSRARLHTEVHAITKSKENVQPNEQKQKALQRNKKRLKKL
jgi:ubiquitin-conjugating enzyme E2 S